MVTMIHMTMQRRKQWRQGCKLRPRWWW